MIEKLTPAQEALLPKYYQKWVAVRDCTDPIDREAVSILRDYLALDNIHPEHFVWCDSPIDCQLKINEEMGTKGVFHQLDFFSSGNEIAGYAGLYEFIVQELLETPPSPEIMETYRLFLEVTKNFHLFYVFDTHVFISERPTAIHRKGDLLHNIYGPAIKYKDGRDFMWYIEGVSVPEWLGKPQPEEIPLEAFFKEQNAELRMAILSKIGVDRLLGQVHTDTIDRISASELYLKHPVGNYYQQGDVLIKPKEIIECEPHESLKEKLPLIEYSVVDIPIGNGEKYRYLVMDNPSIDRKHAEGVPADTKSVWEALKFRNQCEFLPYKLS